MSGEVGYETKSFSEIKLGEAGGGQLAKHGRGACSLPIQVPLRWIIPDQTMLADTKPLPPEL